MLHKRTAAGRQSRPWTPNCSSRSTGRSVPRDLFEEAFQTLATLALIKYYWNLIDPFGAMGKRLSVDSYGGRPSAFGVHYPISEPHG